MVLDYVVPTPMGTTWGMSFMLEQFSVLALLTFLALKTISYYVDCHGEVGGSNICQYG